MTQSWDTTPLASRRDAHFGGHFERLIDTQIGAVHLLPGTTFSNPAERGDYQSSHAARMTLRELERRVGWEVAGSPRYHRRLMLELQPDNYAVPKGQSGMVIRSFVDSITPELIIGWALDIERPNEPVEIIVRVDGAEHGRCTANRERPGLVKALGNGVSGRHEFSYSFEPPLLLRFDTSIVVCVAGREAPLENGIAVLHGSTTAYASLMPILLGSRGRSGTTMLMSEFANHPEIVIGDVYPYEVKHAGYFASAHRVITLPPPVCDPDFAENAAEMWKICGNPANLGDISNATGGVNLLRFFQEVMPRRLSNMFREAVLEAYGIMAAQRGKLDASFFAEKTALQDNVRTGIRNLFGAVREIILVRDPRDYMCSAKAFWQQDSQKVLDLLEITVPALERIHQQAQPDTMFTRYEDLITDPIGTRRRIYQFIGVKHISTEATGGDALFRAHGTSATPTTSIGRWQDGLSQDELAVCTKLCASFMERFGYS